MGDLPGRFIGILGAGRCGSSALAGALHHAGVPMGRTLIAANANNPRGHFEDRDAHYVNRWLVQTWDRDLPEAIHCETLGQYPDLAHAKQSLTVHTRYGDLLRGMAQRPVWGMKDCLLGVLWPALQHLFPADRRLILLERGREATIRSRMAHSYLDYDQATRLNDDLAHAALSTAVMADCPHLTVRYERLMANPEAEMARVLEFVGEGLDGVTLNTAAAINFIDPSLNHQGVH